jgi:hypothetical protein
MGPMTGNTNFNYFLYPPQTKFGGVYRNPSVRPSVHVPCERNSSYALYRTLIQDIVQYKAKVYTTPFINAVKLPIAE